jgi:hypothetical protein
MKIREKRLQMASQNQLAAVLKDELEALRIWQSAKNSRGALVLPDDIWDGMTISIDKIETVLRKSSNLAHGRVKQRNKHGKQCRE